MGSAPAAVSAGKVFKNAKEHRTELCHILPTPFVFFLSEWPQEEAESPRSQPEAEI